MSINTNLYYIGLSGLFTFYAPFNTAYSLDSDSLTIEAIESIGELIASNISIQQIYFTPYGLTQTQYTQFLQSNGVIVKFKDTLGNRYSVPSTFIQGMPDPNGVEYRVLGLNVVLGPLPVSYPTSSLIDEIQPIISAIVGIDVAITPIELSKIKLIATDTATQLETTRINNITDFNTIGYYQTQLNIAQQQIEALESYILTNTPSISNDVALIDTGIPLTYNVMEV